MAFRGSVLRRHDIRYRDETSYDVQVPARPAGLTYTYPEGSHVFEGYRVHRLSKSGVEVAGDKESRKLAVAPLVRQLGHPVLPQIGAQRGAPNDVILYF